MISVEVAYARPEQQMLITLTVPVGCTVMGAIIQSEILRHFPEINVYSGNDVGIFGQPVTLTDVIKAGDRVEIYRPLLMDPKEARRLRQKQSTKTF